MSAGPARTTELQGTVADFDPSAGGRVLLDDGTPVPFDTAAFAVSGLRLLRPGQRVRLRLAGNAGERRVTAVTIVTLPWPTGE